MIVRALPLLFQVNLDDEEEEQAVDVDELELARRAQSPHVDSCIAHVAQYIQQDVQLGAVDVQCLSDDRDGHEVVESARGRRRRDPQELPFEVGDEGDARI